MMSWREWFHDNPEEDRYQAYKARFLEEEATFDEVAEIPQEALNGLPRPMGIDTPLGRRVTVSGVEAESRKLEKLSDPFQVREPANPLIAKLEAAMRSAEISAENAAAWAVIAESDGEMIEVLIGKPESLRPGEVAVPLFWAPDHG